MRHLKEWVSSPRRGCLGFCFIIFTFTLYVHLYFLCLGLLSFAFCLMLHFTCCCPCFTFLLFTWPFSFHLLRLLQHTICILFSHPSYHCRGTSSPLGALTSSPGVHGDRDRAAAPLSEAQELYEEGRRGKVQTGSRFCLSRQSRSRFPTAHGAKGKRKSMHAAPPPPRL